MKRNKEFLNGLLLAFEDTQDPYLDTAEIVEAAGKLGVTANAEIEHHLLLLSDEGLITTGPQSNLFRLTSRGHDALDVAKSVGIFG